VSDFATIRFVELSMYQRSHRVPRLIIEVSSAAAKSGEDFIADVVVVDQFAVDIQ
jgi:hypothetical protein